MNKLRSELRNLKSALDAIHEDSGTTPTGRSGRSSILLHFTMLCFVTAHKIEDLLKLEAKYGPLPGFTPAIDDVLNYLKQVKHILSNCSGIPQTSWWKSSMPLCFDGFSIATSF